ncbi:MAG TPA: adenylyl-sulfate kinase [Piscirickettsiaceae bacterium]|nr:adenylyl-sulfate kinase [Piscirickettsiaceae bacterium]
MKRKFNIVWLTGMSGSGKSTLAEYIKNTYQNEGYTVRIIDGDDIRDRDVEKLGFGRKDVEVNNLRIAKLCLESKDSGFDLILVPVISPYDEVRKRTRSLLEPYYHLVYVEADIDSLKKRDTKGLYKAADQGLINDLIGYSEINPYDKPSDADFVVNTNNNTLLNDSKQSLLGFVKSITI